MSVDKKEWFKYNHSISEHFDKAIKSLKIFRDLRIVLDNLLSTSTNLDINVYISCLTIAIIDDNKLKEQYKLLSKIEKEFNYDFVNSVQDLYDLRKPEEFEKYCIHICQVDNFLIDLDKNVDSIPQLKKILNGASARDIFIELLYNIATVQNRFVCYALNDGASEFLKDLENKERDSFRYIKYFDFNYKVEKSDVEQSNTLNKSSIVNEDYNDTDDYDFENDNDCDDCTENDEEYEIEHDGRYYDYGEDAYLEIKAISDNIPVKKIKQYLTDWKSKYKSNFTITNVDDVALLNSILRYIMKNSEDVKCFTVHYDQIGCQPPFILVVFDNVPNSKDRYDCKLCEVSMDISEEFSPGYLKFILSYDIEEYEFIYNEIEDDGDEPETNWCHDNYINPKKIIGISEADTNIYEHYYEIVLSNTFASQRLFGDYVGDGIMSAEAVLSTIFKDEDTAIIDYINDDISKKELIKMINDKEKMLETLKIYKKFEEYSDDDHITLDDDAIKKINDLIKYYSK